MKKRGADGRSYDEGDVDSWDSDNHWWHDAEEVENEEEGSRTT